MRFAAGKFGMGGMIEEGVTNLIPADKQKFEGWAVYQGATVTLTQNVTVPEWSTDKATRIQTNGGTHVVKYFLVVLTSVNGQAYTETIRVKNSGTADMIVGNFLGATATIQAGQSADVAITSTGNGSSQHKIECRATTATDNLDFIAYQPMATATAYPLTFTDSTRAAEVMTLPTAGIWTPGNWQVDMVVTPITATVITGVYRRAFSIKTDANNWIDCMVNATGRLYVAVTSGGAQNHTSNVGDVVLETGKNYPATFKGNGSTIAMFVNGVKGLAGDKAYSEPLGALPSFMTFGCLEDKTLYANFIYEHIRIGTARPDAEIIASHAATSNPFPIDALTTAKIDFNAITYRKPNVGVM
jgi:hypothetical protein